MNYDLRIKILNDSINKIQCLLNSKVGAEHHDLSIKLTKLQKELDKLEGRDKTVYQIRSLNLYYFMSMLDKDSLVALVKSGDELVSIGKLNFEYSECDCCEGMDRHVDVVKLLDLETGECYLDKLRESI